MTLIKATTFTILIGLLSASGPSQAQEEQESLIVGQVANVDFKAGTIAVSHRPNADLGLSQMTDNFRVSDPIMLNALRPGAKVKFAAKRLHGALTITRILAD